MSGGAGGTSGTGRVDAGPARAGCARRCSASALAGGALGGRALAARRCSRAPFRERAAAGAPRAARQPARARRSSWPRPRAWAPGSGSPPLDLDEVARAARRRILDAQRAASAALPPDRLLVAVEEREPVAVAPIGRHELAGRPRRHRLPAGAEGQPLPVLLGAAAPDDPRAGRRGVVARGARRARHPGAGRAGPDRRRSGAGARARARRGRGGPGRARPARRR